MLLQLSQRTPLFGVGGFLRRFHLCKLSFVAEMLSYDMLGWGERGKTLHCKNFFSLGNSVVLQGTDRSKTASKTMSSIWL